MSPGEQLIDLVHVDDVVAAFQQAADRLTACHVADHECYAVSSGCPISLRSLVDEVEKILCRSLPIVWGGRPYREREVMVPWQGPKLPDWNPHVRLVSGLSKVIRE